jgi:hypothetical protein
MKANKVVSHRSQKRFENPILRVKIETQENESWIKSLDFETSDTYPVLLNGDEVKNKINLLPGVFEKDQEERELSAYFLLHVNSQGRVTRNNSSWSENSTISRAVEELFPSLKFNPGTRSGRKVDSYIGFRVRLWLEEKPPN